MKSKLFLSVFLLLSLAACQSGPATHDHSQPAAGTEVHNHSHENETPALSLNKGAKWETDASTRQHAVLLQRMANSFQSSESTPLQAYHQHAAAVQEELNQLIKDCRMKGPEHDALHLWLEPVLHRTRALSETEDPAAAATATKQLQEDILKFSQYFN